MTALLTAALLLGSVHAAQPAQIEATATYYGPGYDSRPLGCGGTYWSTDPTIVAVGPGRYGVWPCGQQLQIEGPAGSIVVTRQDSCPGCPVNMVDLSDAANAAVCGYPPRTCGVVVTEVGP